MKRSRKKTEANRCYHLIFRLTQKTPSLTREGRTQAVEMMRRAEEFSGVFVLAYAFMERIIHIYVYVPEPEALGDDELLRRVKALYVGAQLGAVLSEWQRLKEEEAAEPVTDESAPRRVSRFSQYKTTFLRRMWSPSEFIHTFRKIFAKLGGESVGGCDRVWKGRYRERNHELDATLMRQNAAYIDVEAVGTGAAGRPDGYPWCSFAAACRGDEKARAGYALMYGTENGWPAIRARHEMSIRAALATIGERPGWEAGRAERRARRRRDPKAAKARGIVLERGLTDVAVRILDLLKESKTMSPAALRDAIGITSRIHFNRYYIAPLLKQGLIVRTIPDKPKSPHQMYALPSAVRPVEPAAKPVEPAAADEPRQ